MLQRAQARGRACVIGRACSVSSTSTYSPSAAGAMASGLRSYQIFVVAVCCCSFACRFNFLRPIEDVKVGLAGTPRGMTTNDQRSKVIPGAARPLIARERSWWFSLLS